MPAGYKVYRVGTRGGAAVLRETPVVRGDELVDAQPGFDQRTNEPIITFRFNNAGARKFGNFTKDHVNRPFAIVLDDKVISAPGDPRADPGRLRPDQRQLHGRDAPISWRSS